MIGTLTQTKSRDGDQAAPIKLSIIVPVLNEASSLPALIPHLKHWQKLGCEIILVDGGSTDQTVAILEPEHFCLIHSLPGRAIQMNAGAQVANGQMLLFLHADTLLPTDALSQVLNVDPAAVWGRFDVVIFGKKWMLSVVATFMNFRSRLTGIATGDQAIFMKKTIYYDVGGFPEQPLMEDIEISKRLLRFGRPACLSTRVLTSGRRWLERGVWSTILLMWRLRWRYWRGISPEKLAKEYQ